MCQHLIGVVSSDTKKALAQIEKWTNQIAEVAEGSQAHPTRAAAVSQTCDQIDEALAKLGAPGQHGAPRYPHSETTDLLHHENLRHEGSTMMLKPTTYQTSSQGAFRAFDDLVERNHAKGMSRTAAMTQARLEEPDTFASAYYKARPRVVHYPESDVADSAVDSGKNKKQSHPTRTRRHRNETPDHLNKSFEQMVQQEIAKSGGYMSEETAGQRVLNTWGDIFPRETISKADDYYAELRDRANDILDSGEAVDRCDALRKARLQNEHLYKRLV